MSQGYSGLPSYYVQSANPITPNLGLSLKGCDPIVAEDFVLIDTAFGSISASIEVNGVVVPAPANLINSATVVFSVSGSNISATASGGGGGGVSSFSAGNLIPLFTTSVATPTTTPALSFSLDTQAAGTVFAGPATGLNAAPTFRALVATDIPALPYLPSSTQLPQTIAATAHEWLNSYTSTTGLFTATQPNFTDIAGSIAIGQTPLTTAGDLLYANSTPALDRLGIGTTGQVLTVVGGLPAWTTIVSGVTSVFGRTGAVVATTGDYTVAQVTGAAPLASPTFTGTAAFSNITVSGTTSFAAGSIAYTALSGTPTITNAWSALTNAAANLTLANAGFSTTFNQTSAVPWLWANTTVGTVGSTNASPLLELAANYWATGGVTGVDLWTVGTAALTAGLNSPSTLTFTHTGSTGNAAVRVPQLDIGGTDNGISRLGAASLAIGNGTAGDFTGALSLANITVSGTYTDSSSSVGTSGQLLSSTVTGTEWVTALASGTTAVTQTPIDNSTLIATDAFVQTAVQLSMATVPLSITGGTYSFASLGVNALVNYTAAAGAITAIILWIPFVGSGYVIGDVITPAGGNYDAMIQVTAISGAGAPTAGTIIYGGTGYISGTSKAEGAAISVPYTWLLSGVLTSKATFIMTPGTYLTQSNQWIFCNNTTGSYTVTVGVAGPGTDAASGGRTVVIPQGTNNSRSVLVQTDGELNTDLCAIINGADLTVGALQNGMAATTQLAGDNTTKIATDAFVQTAIGGAGAVLWSNLGNAAGALTLANAGFTTTFNQTSAVLWDWENTTVASAITTNASPLLGLSAQYWTGAASANDQWTIGSALAAGSNAQSTLTIAHTGSTAIAQLRLPSTATLTLPSIIGSYNNATGVTIGNASGYPLLIAMDTTGQWLDCSCQGNRLFQLQGSASTQGVSLAMEVNNTSLNFVGPNNAVFSNTTQPGLFNFGVSRSGATSFTGGTSGETTIVNIGAGYLQGSAVQTAITWAPTTGSGHMTSCLISPAINQTGSASGSYTCLKIAAVEVALLGTANKLIDCYAGTTGTTQEWSLSNTGVISTYGATATVKNGVPSLVASMALTGQSAAITGMTIYAVPAGKAGFYRITYSATVTTAGTTSVLGGTNGMQSVYTSIADGQVKTSIPTTPVISAANTTGTEISSVVCAYAQASTNIQYNFGYTSTGTAMIYAIEIYCEYLG